MKKVNTFIFVIIIILSLCACNNSSNKNHTHSFEQWEISKNPTCTEEGLKIRYCSCGEMQSQNISALGHNEVIDETVEPTCTKTGLTEGKHCSLCGEVLVAQEEIPALGHTFENGKCIDCKEEDPDFVSLTLTSSTYNINLTDYS